MTKASHRAPSGSCCAAVARIRPRATGDFVPLFKALSDETRLEIVAMLAAAGGELCACDIESHFELSQPTISHHLATLRRAGLVDGERRGSWVYYSLARSVGSRVSDFLDLLAIDGVEPTRKEPR